MLDQARCGKQCCLASILFGSISALAPVVATLAAEPAEPTTASASPETRTYTYAELHPYLYDEFSPGEGGTGGVDDLEEIKQPHEPVGDPSGFDSPLNFVRGHTDALEERFGLRLGTAFTSLGIGATGAGGDPFLASYDFDLMSAWTLVGRGTRDTGVLVATVEYRDGFTDDPASALGGKVGALINPVHTFNDRGWVLRDAHWLQRFANDTVRVMIGRAATDDYVGLQPMQNVNSQFLSRHFSANPTVSFPGHGPMIGVSVRPGENAYVTGGIASAYGNALESEWDSIDDGDYFYSAEAGLTPELAGLGRGRYSIMVWYIDERTRDGFIPSDQGVSLVAGQQLNERLQVWGRYAYADAKTTNIRQILQGGIGYAGLFGSASNLSGVALSFARPRSGAARDETVLEAFQRLQITRFTQLSAGAQLIVDPGNNPKDDLLTVFYARLRIAF